MQKWKYIPDFGNQINWNQTFVTALNVVCLSKNITKETVSVKIPERFRPLINSLLFYDKDTDSIKKQYAVEFTASRGNVVYVENHPLEIIGYQN